MSDRIENVILENLIHSDEYCRKVLPFLKLDYFQERSEQIILQQIDTYFSKYNTLPTKQIIQIESSNRTDVKEDELKDIENLVNSYSDKNINIEWLIQETERYCQDRALYNAIMHSIKVIDGKVQNVTKDALPSILSDALAVSFDTNIGHSYIDDWESRFDLYHLKEDKIPFDIELLNNITKGGLSKKTLNVLLASTGVGKSLVMCHIAASTIAQGKNVLYITAEMSEEKIAERIDANLLNVNIAELETMDKSLFETRIKRLMDKSIGKLIIKEYPTSSAHVGHFRALLEELKLKKNFKPDMIIIDYLNICASQKLKFGNSVNSYSYVKSIAEEFRGLAVEYEVPIISATQSTRDAANSTDMDLTNTSESFGLPATCDLFLGLISTEELEGMQQLMIKQLKNRYNSLDNHRRFTVGIDRSKMRLFDLEDSAQANISGKGSTDYTPFKDNPMPSLTKTKQVSTSDFVF
jgi:replicative DNA helicase